MQVAQRTEFITTATNGASHDDRDEHLLRARAESAELREALQSNRTIGAAVGIVMERYDLDADAALAFLKRVSSQHNRKLRDLATTLVETRRFPTPTPDA